ncbi:MAG: hypothetical protein JXB42_01655 [Deltaproteobacteria bacterium]|nr:hypothetical protein [Deltaproteobacteria bacterium]
MKKIFPNLKTYEITSPPTIEYNCIAWALGDDKRWWWPDPNIYSQYYWPPEIPRGESVDNFVKAFETFGYIECDGPELEEGFEKIAIYADKYGKPTHAVRQLESGIWTSKLGQLEDISHDIDGVSGEHYGNVVIVLKRSK